MSILLFIGIIINTIAFGVMGLRRNKLGIRVPQLLYNEALQMLITIIYFGSFIIILASPGELIWKIILCLLMQFVINHIVWGIIMGVIGGIFFKDKPNSIEH